MTIASSAPDSCDSKFILSAKYLRDAWNKLMHSLWWRRRISLPVLQRHPWQRRCALARYGLSTVARAERRLQKSVFMQDETTTILLTLNRQSRLKWDLACHCHFPRRGEQELWVESLLLRCIAPVR